MPRRLRVRRIWLPLVILLLFPLVKGEAAQVAGVAQSRTAKAGKGASTPEVGEVPKPQLLNADITPTLRYPVAANADRWVSYGWLDVTRTGLRYSVVVAPAGSTSPPARRFVSPASFNYLADPISKRTLMGVKATEEGFEALLSDITVAEIGKGVLEIQTSEIKINLTYVPQDQWGFAQNQRAFFQLADQNVAGTTSIHLALSSFATVLATVKLPAPPPLEVALHAEPSSVEKGRSVALVWTSSNATSLDLEPGVGHVAAAGGISVAPQASTNYTLIATGPAGTKTASVFVTVTQPAPAAPPTIVLIEPSAAGEGQTVEVASSPLIIRGVVMDATGIPVVTVNGTPTSMRPTSAQAAQFTSDPLTLQPGENQFEVVATNNAKGRARVSFVARFSASAPKALPPEPANLKRLSKAEILGLLQGDVPSARVAELVKARGVKFVPTPDDLKEIRGAGGLDDLIDAITQASTSAQ